MALNPLKNDAEGDMKDNEDELTIKDHVRLAERHAQKALDLSYSTEPQNFFVRASLGRAQSILISLIANNRLRSKKVSEDLKRLD